MRIDGCDKPIAYCDEPNLFGHRHHSSFRSRKDSAQPTAGRSKAGRQEAARDSVAGGWRFDGKSTVGEGRRQLAEAIGPCRVGRNSVCMCGGRWRDSPGVGAGERHTGPAAPGGVARLILLSRSEARDIHKFRQLRLKL